MRTSKIAVDNIINQKTIAIIGVSRSGKKIGNTIYTDMKRKGYQVFPVNPNTSEIDGEKCYSNLNEIPEIPGALILCVKPDETEKVVREAAEIGIQNVWMQLGSESEEAVKFCKENNINTVHKECILMFVQPVEGVHKFHKFFNKIFGKLPN